MRTELLKVTENAQGMVADSTARWLVRCGVRYTITFVAGWLLISALADRPLVSTTSDNPTRVPFWESFVEYAAYGWQPLLRQAGQSLLVLVLIAHHRHKEAPGSFRLRATFLLLIPLWSYLLFTPPSMLLVMVAVQVVFGALIMPLNVTRRSKRGSRESVSSDPACPGPPES
ncbi:hypothetical protein ACIRPT_35145 [Streptomyces sp. NPDC101227]|uniref:hypothetical protein n=1 Tax=Streptomyces sp. NPDC101227 TaxID=3366136 RepID=UPI003807BCF2